MCVFDVIHTINKDIAKVSDFGDLKRSNIRKMAFGTHQARLLSYATWSKTGAGSKGSPAIKRNTDQADIDIVQRLRDGGTHKGGDFIKARSLLRVVKFTTNNVFFHIGFRHDLPSGFRSCAFILNIKRIVHQWLVEA